MLKNQIHTDGDMIMQRYLARLFLLTALFASINVNADTELSYDRVHLSAEVKESVRSDQMIADLFFEVEGKNTRTMADQVNRTIGWAMKRAQRTPGVESETTSYQTTPVYNKRTVVGWRIRQAIRLHSLQSDILGELIAQLQEKLSVQSLRYDLSSATRDRINASLTDKAIQSFMRKAQHISEQFGFKGFRLVQVNVSSGGSVRPIARMAMMDSRAEIAAPTITPGNQQLTVSVSGTIELSNTRIAK